MGPRRVSAERVRCRSAAERRQSLERPMFGSSVSSMSPRFVGSGGSGGDRTRDAVRRYGVARRCIAALPRFQRKKEDSTPYVLPSLRFEAGAAPLPLHLPGHAKSPEVSLASWASNTSGLAYRRVPTPLFDGRVLGRFPRPVGDEEVDPVGASQNSSSLNRRAGHRARVLHVGED